MKHDSETAARAADFARRLAQTGMGITDFQRVSGLTRNVVYNLSKGPRPSSARQAEQLAEAFKRHSDPLRATDDNGRRAT